MMCWPPFFIPRRPGGKGFKEPVAPSILILLCSCLMPYYACLSGVKVDIYRRQVGEQAMEGQDKNGQLGRQGYGSDLRKPCTMNAFVTSY